MDLENTECDDATIREFGHSRTKYFTNKAGSFSQKV
jgi:hypothetical protein